MRYLCCGGRSPLGLPGRPLATSGASPGGARSPSLWRWIQGTAQGTRRSCWSPAPSGFTTTLSGQMRLQRPRRRLPGRSEHSWVELRPGAVSLLKTDLLAASRARVRRRSAGTARSGSYFRGARATANSLSFLPWHSRRAPWACRRTPQSSSAPRTACPSRGWALAEASRNPRRRSLPRCRRNIKSRSCMPTSTPTSAPVTPSVACPWAHVTLDWATGHVVTSRTRITS
mmetsp:Transcript_73944/g.233557  ORF Transcript_73944/g.233557 Transcript_73944/m.233557 type:complete len:229 (+) Transcript_73944:578-1264(+)